MIIILGSSSIILPVILSALFWNNLTRLQKSFYFFILFSLIVEGVSVFTSLKGINNRFLFEFFLISDLLFFIWFFNKFSPFVNWLKIISGLLLLYIISWKILVSNFDVSEGVQSLFFIFIFLYFVVQSADIIIRLFDNLELSPVKNFIFWIASARLFYYLFILFIYVYPHLISNSFKNIFFSIIFNVINSTGNIVCNIMYGISFYGRK